MALKLAEQTVHVSNVPHQVQAKELAQVLEKEVGTVCHCELKCNRYPWRHDGYGFVQFLNRAMCERAMAMAAAQSLHCKGNALRVRLAKHDIKLQPKHSATVLEEGSLSMGCLSGPSQMAVLWSSPAECGTSLELDFQARMLCIWTQLEGPGPFLANCCKWEYKMELPFRELAAVEPLLLPHCTHALLIHLCSLPRISKRLKQQEQGQQHLFLNLLEGASRDMFTYSKDAPQLPWVRSVDFTPNRSLAQSWALCIQLPTVCTAVYSGALDKLTDFHITSASASPRQLSLVPVLPFSLDSLIAPILSSPLASALPFDILFLLHSLLHKGILTGPCLSPQFFSFLYPDSPPLHLPKEAILCALAKLSRQTHVCYDPVAYMVEESRKGEEAFSAVVGSRVYDELMRVHRMLVTPSRAVFLGPEMDVSNRVTRQYMDEIDGFLRVSFVDEDLDYLPSSSLSVPVQAGVAAGLHPERSDVYRRIRQLLREGFTFGGKRYQFLAFSSSQLREQSVWMFAGEQQCVQMREWMGDFLSIRNVAECADRMGQCFSSSTPTLDVPKHQVEYLGDVEREYGGTRYCFSDGIGKVSLAFASQVAAKCAKTCGTVPSAFHIRYGGYKGVVAIDPWSNIKLSLRDSMKKFSSQHVGLEVLNFSRLIPSFLNRQIITLLSTLGVEEQVLRQIQDRMLEQLQSMLQEARVALEVLEVACSGNMHLASMEMLRAGFSPCQEPHLNAVLTAFRAMHLMDLRTKARILVPKGRCLMGCLDESATLRYGQVFLQLSPTPGNRCLVDDGLRQFPHYRAIFHNQAPAFVVLGKVVIAKNPCVHPGDIRVLQAVDIPHLRHMLDCLVFPQLGPRPHPNECSGSDLDGDLYFVSWDQRLVPPATDAPMHYTPAIKTKLDHPITVEEIQQFFLDHMVNDSVGVIANAHVVLSDKSPEKARDPRCLELAKLLAIAVDFPKTGVPAVMPANLRPEEYPDFMEKPNSRTYVSTGVLGKLYRAVRDVSKQQQHIQQLTKKDIARAFDKNLLVEGFQAYLDEAAVMKNHYDQKLVALMNQYGIQSEAEAVSGNILSLSRHYKRRQGDVRERVMLAMSGIHNQARKWFHHGFNCEGHNSAEEADITPQHVHHQKASSWYYVTYHPDYLDDEPQTPHLISFPWVVYDQLVAIKTMAAQNDPCNQM